MALPILYTCYTCPYAMRARFALAYAQIQCEMREVVLSEKPEEMIALSPKGTTPVLHLPDGTVIDESIAVMRWACEQSDPQNWWSHSQEKSQEQQTLIEQWIEKNDTVFAQITYRYIYIDKHPDHNRADLLKEADDFFSELEQALNKNTYLIADHATFADMALLPFIHLFFEADNSWQPEQQYPKLAAWWRTLTSQSWVQALTISEKGWSPNDAPRYLPLAS